MSNRLRVWAYAWAPMKYLLFTLLMFAVAACNKQPNTEKTADSAAVPVATPAQSQEMGSQPAGTEAPAGLETAVLAGGCF
jgi:hypothetical protein